MGFKLYTEYRFAGRGTATAVIIPIKREKDELKVIHKSVSAKIKYMDVEKVRTLVDNNLIEDGVNRSLVEQSHLGRELSHKLEKILESNGGSLERDEWKKELKSAEESVSD